MAIKHSSFFFAAITLFIGLQFLLSPIAFAETYGEDTYGGSEYGGTEEESSGGGGGGGGGGGSSRSSRTTTTTTATTTVTTTTDTTVASLLVRIAELQAILASLKGQSTTTTLSGTPFLYDLEWGVADPDVLRLQKFLNAKGYPVSTVAGSVGAAGFETDFFGVKTKDAVIKFQLANSISPAVGYFGPITRTLVNSLLK